MSGYKLLGLDDELKLALEESNITHEAAQKIIETSVNAASDMVTKATEAALKEVQSVIGPHGSVTRLQAGGMKISQAEGVAVYLDGIRKSTIEPDGDFFAGSDIDSPADTTFSVFVNDQIYNNEQMYEGDLLIGDNTSTVANVKYDVTTGQLQFRYGTTVKAYMDTDGSIRAGDGEVLIDSDGILINIPSSINTVNAYKFGDTSTLTIYGGLYGFRSSSITEMWEKIEDNGAVAKFQLAGSSTGGRFVVDAINGTIASSNINELLVQWYSGNAITILNNQGLDVNTQIKTNGDDNTIWVDGGNDNVGMGTATPDSNAKLDINGAIKVDSIVNDTGLAAGTYTPTLTDVANTNTSSSAAQDFNYLRVGNMVIVTGDITVDHDGSGTAQIGISLPVASNFTSSYDLNGNASHIGSSVDYVASLASDATNDRATLFISDTVGAGSNGWRIIFMYIVQ